MPVDFQIKGNFQITEPLVFKLVQQCSGQLIIPCKDIKLEIICPSISITAFYQKKEKYFYSDFDVESTATIFFSLNNKDQIVQATNLVIECTQVVLNIVPNDLLLLMNGDIPLLGRKEDDLLLFFFNVDNEFWNEYRKVLIRRKFKKVYIDI